MNCVNQPPLTEFLANHETHHFQSFGNPYKWNSNGDGLCWCFLQAKEALLRSNSYKSRLPITESPFLIKVCFILNRKDKRRKEEKKIASWESTKSFCTLKQVCPNCAPGCSWMECKFSFLWNSYLHQGLSLQIHEDEKKFAVSDQQSASAHVEQ